MRFLGVFIVFLSLVVNTMPLAAQVELPLPREPVATNGVWCRGNIVQNGGFTDGIVIPQGSAGSLPQAKVSNWTAAYGTPQIASQMGCKDNGYFAFWGNQVVGEAIQQPVNFVQGTTYIIEFCARNRQAPIPFVNVQLRASTTPLTSTACPAGNCEVIATTANITSTAWGTHQFCWTPTKNYSHLTISPTNNISINDGSQVSWAEVDNICVRPAPLPRISGPATTCVLPATYCVTPAVAGATYSWTVPGGALFSDIGNGCIVVTSNSGGMWSGGQIDVTVTPPPGSGCPTKSSFTVKPCPEKACCGDVVGAKNLGVTPLAGQAGWTVTAGLSSPPATKVKATIVSATRTVSPSSCGANGPFAVSASNPVTSGSWTGSVPILGGNSVIWTSAPSAVPPLTFTVNSPPPATGCSEVDTVCIEYTITYPPLANGRCATCSITRCFTQQRKK